MRAIVTNFGPAEIAALADIERVTVHDVKAVEYFLQAVSYTHLTLPTSDLV